MSKVGNSYMTRALKANDRRYAKILDRLGYAQPQAPAADEDAAKVRAEYQRQFGKRPWMSWDVPTMRQKMAKAEMPKTDAAPVDE